MKNLNTPLLEKIIMFDFAKFQAFLFGLIGLLSGILYSIGMLILDCLVPLSWLTWDGSSGLSLDTLITFEAILVMPFIGVFIGFLFGVIGFLLYNQWTKWFPSLSIEWNHVIKK